VTAKHVVETSTGNVASDVAVEAGSGGFQPACKVQLLDFCDIALIELADALPEGPLEPDTGATEPEAGTKFRAPGFPVNVGERWQPGELVGRVKLGEYEIRFDHAFTTQLSGLSGAPVLDSENHVLGVIIQHDPLTPTAGKMVPLVDFKASLDFKTGAPGFRYLVIFSDHEPPADGVLRTAVGEAIAVLAAEWNQQVDLTQRSATECVSSDQSYRDIVHRLCQTDVCIFDVTAYEPAVMLLLGIRSVVRRGITIASTAAGVEDAPYDIRELSLLTHRQPSSKGLKLRNVIAGRIRAGRAAQNLQHYLDLPTFDLVRNLPPGRRSEVLPDECALLLSSYDPTGEANFQYIQDRLQFELQKRRIENPNISRVVDLNLTSPWLVSQNMYEAIRRTKLCIVDWTGFPVWPANVFFELGVRISVRPSRTLSILEQGVPPTTNGSGATLTKQQENLISLFEPVRYQLADVKGVAFTQMMTESDVFAQHDREDPSEYTFREITRSIDARQGMNAKRVWADLLQSAQLLSADDTEALSSVLYPQNRGLSVAAGAAVKERLWAAWYYVNSKYTIAEIANDPDLCNSAKDIAQGLKAVLGSNDPQLNQVNEIIKQILRLTA